MITMTYELAHAAAWDAGNRSMRAAGRKLWNQDDWNAMRREFDRLWPEPVYPSRPTGFLGRHQPSILASPGR